jgi:hypothetical protein
MRKATIGGLFGAMFDFFRSSWYVIIGSLVAVALLFTALFAVFFGFEEQAGGPTAAQTSGLVLLVLLILPLMLAAQLISYRHAYLRGEASVMPDIGWSVGAGFTAAFSMFVVGIALLIAFYIVILIFGLIAVAAFGAAGGFSADSLTDPAGVAGLGGGLIALIVIAYLLFYIAYFWFYGRLVAAGPVMAAERSFNPFSALAQSWRQTGPSQWVVLGFQLIVLFVPLFIVGFILGFTGAMSGTGLASGIGVVGGLFIVLLYVVMIFVGLALPYAVFRETSNLGSNSSDIFA